jgi:hypothetical protein
MILDYVWVGITVSHLLELRFLLSIYVTFFYAIDIDRVLRTLLVDTHGHIHARASIFCSDGLLASSSCYYGRFVGPRSVCSRTGTR